MNLIILSSNYLDQEMQVEFGHLPPAFLPVGNKLLVEQQIEQFPSHQVYLSLPDCYTKTEAQSEIVSSLGIATIQLSNNLSIGEVICKIADEVELDVETKLLFGDTLRGSISLK